MFAPAPGLVITVTGCPMAAAISSASTRMMRSVLPPATNGTTTWMGWVG